MTVELVIYQLMNGLIWGLILALIALGLSLIYGILNVINIAHAALYTLGAVVAWWIVRHTGNFWAALVLAPLFVAAVGVVMEVVVLRRIAGDFILSILATVGILMILQDSVLATFGGGLERIDTPIEGSFPVLGLRYPYYRLFVAGFSVIVILGFWIFLNRTRYGNWIRAVNQDSRMATAMGIPVPWVHLLTIALGGLFAGLGGVLAAPIVVIEYQMGLKILATTFIIVVVGGFGSIMGSVGAAILIGCLEGLLVAFLGSTEAKIATLLLMSLVVLWRPEGIFRRRLELAK